jgi:ribosomal-protein-alanine N-acetyltransferase
MRTINIRPYSQLETDRLTLRWITPNEANFVHFMRSNPRVNQFINRPDKISLEEANNIINLRVSDHEQNKSSYWVIRSKTADEPIGTISLWNFSEDMEKAELGYELHPEHHGKGIMTEAIKKMLDVAFNELGFVRVEACTHFENTPSLKMIKRIGFIHQGDLDDPGHPNNVVYQIEKNAFSQ